MRFFAINWSSCGAKRGASPADQQRSPVLCPAVLLVSFDSEALQLSGLRRSCGGIGLGFAATGAGNRAHGEGGRRWDGLRKLIGQMSAENPLWGAPHIHGELLKLGFDVAQSTVSKYMVRGKAGRRKDGRRSFRTTLTGSRRWICSWFRRLPLSNSSHFLFSATDGGSFCGLR